MPVLLDPRRAKPGKAIFVDGSLPGQEFFDRQLIALAGFIEAEQTATDGGNDFRLAPDNPAPRIGWREIGNRKRAAVGPNNIFNARSYQIGHSTLYTTLKDPIPATVAPQL
jgi:hypothetical protein